ncbi:hypothetical protein [Amaricoccus sp. W119]|uniref:hypothetical protein n=1 Tax=Amaricoccus sp. W119 TaxID=3391833 RepID=UPI0039A6BD07
MDEETLTLRLDYEDPLELTILSRSLTRLGQRYVRFSKADDLPEATLVIKNIRQNCLIIDLTPLAVIAGAVASASDPISNAVAFTANLKVLLEFFLGRGPRPEVLTRTDCDDVREIVQPIAVQRDGGLLIQASGQSDVNVTISLNAVEANAVQNRAETEKARLTEATSTIEEGAIFYWQVADKHAAAAEGTTPDRGVIEKIERTAKRVFFSEPALKSEMLSGHPFETAYLVDAEVLVARGRVQGYRIVKVHDSFPMDE